MRAGYLYLQTHSDYPDLIRVLKSEYRPERNQELTDIPYIAYFNDLDAAKMHFHNELQRQLVDINAGLYRVPLTKAIATIEAAALRHRRIWLDPALSTNELQQIKVFTAQRHRHHRYRNMIWRVVGGIAILWLLFHALSGIR